MRCFFGRFVERVKTFIGEAPFAASLIVLRSRRRDSLKILTWSRGGAFTDPRNLNTQI